MKTKHKIATVIIVVVSVVGILSARGLIPESVSKKATDISVQIADKSERVIGDVIQSLDKGNKEKQREVQEKVAEPDSAKPLTVAEGNVSLDEEKATPYEMPELVRGYQYFTRLGFCGQYDMVAHAPLWIAYELTVDDLKANTSRSEEWNEDEDVIACAKLADFRNNPLSMQRGHLKPSADALSSAEYNQATFVMSNVVAQSAKLNGKLWLKTEDACRDAVRYYGKAYIATGPVLTEEAYGYIGNHVFVPKRCWKAILVFDKNGEAHAIAMICPQEYDNGELKRYLCSVDELEAVIGFNLFENLSAEQEKAESSYDPNAWPKSFR